tara:strand:- start:2917 stop:3198 length:282 start_codon:yes stop_codon:yes gene_type:complete
MAIIWVDIWVELACSDENWSEESKDSGEVIAEVVEERPIRRAAVRATGGLIGMAVPFSVVGRGGFGARNRNRRVFGAGLSGFWIIGEAGEGVR